MNKIKSKSKPETARERGDILGGTPFRKFYVELFAPNQNEWVRPGPWDDTLEAAIKWSKNQPEEVRDWKKRIVLVETTTHLIDFPNAEVSRTEGEKIS